MEDKAVYSFHQVYWKSGGESREAAECQMALINKAWELITGTKHFKRVLGIL